MAAVPAYAGTQKGALPVVSEKVHQVRDLEDTTDDAMDTPDEEPVTVRPA